MTRSLLAALLASAAMLAIPSAQAQERPAGATVMPVPVPVPMAMPMPMFIPPFFMMPGMPMFNFMDMQALQAAIAQQVMVPLMANQAALNAMRTGLYQPGRFSGSMWSPQPLSVTSVRGNLEQWLAFTGNTQFRVGAVTEGESGYAAEILAPDGKTIDRLLIDRATGAVRSAH
ncbi:MAG: hypothetical protein K2Q10_06515 [Rhodospirillales bacterium]|nr:hypothetical protein [Rhodospirillales bacterium]